MKKALVVMKNKLFWIGFFALAIVTHAAFAEDATGLKPEEIAKISDEAQKTLNGFSWTLEVAPSGVKKEDRKTTPDTVIFKDGKMSSDGLSKKGYGTSNYTLTVGDDGVPVFETMQRDENDGVAFWRGELVDGKIRGVISVQASKSPATSFAFHGEKAGEAKDIPAVKDEPQPEPVIEKTVPPVVDESATVAADSVTPAVTDAKEEVTAVADENIPAIPVVEAPAPEPVQPEPVQPPKKKRGFFG